MSLPAFNPLNYINDLTKGGFTREQAEVQARALLNIVEEELASKRDIKETETILRTEIRAVENSLRAEIKEVENTLRAEIKEVESSLRAEIKGVESSLRAEIREIKSEMKGKFALLHWMFGFLLAANVATLGGVITIVLKGFHI